MSYSRLVVGDRFGSLLAELSVDIEFVNWRLNNIGQCKFNIATTDPKTTATNLRYGNRILIDFENGLTNWGGVIEPPRTWQDGQITINAYSAEHILKYRTTDKGKYFTNAAVGTIYKSLIDDANAVNNTGIIPGDIWEGGTGHSPDYHFKKIFEIFQKSLTKRLSTSDFDITAELIGGVITFTANFYESKGSDKTSIALIQDKNLSKVKLKEQGPIVNSWDIAGEGTSWDAERLTANSTDLESINEFGLREDSKVYGDVSEQTTLDDHAANLLAVSKNPFNIYTLDALDTDPAGFASYGIGDSVSLLAPDYGFGGTKITIRILSREFSPQTGICSLVVQEEL